MPTEIEHKFLVKNDAWREQVDVGIRYSQGYVSISESGVVRARAGGDRGFITIKGATVGTTRLEYEYEIPQTDAIEIIDRLCGTRIIDKTRYRLPFRGFVWEVDEFHHSNSGLVLAEIELEFVGQDFTKPKWVGDDVSHDPRFTNAMLAVTPYPTWKD